MNIVIITQEEPFYLAQNISYLLKIMPIHSKVVGCVVNEVSPFGKKESFFHKAKKTFDIFGVKFFIHYSVKFIVNKFKKENRMISILENNNIPIITLNKPINNIESVAKIKNLHPDLLVSILGNQLFKESIINLAPKGCLNLHTALLPKYRGLMPSFWVLKNNEKETGVSVFFVDKGIDSGPILVQKRLPIHKSMSQEELIKKSKKMGMDAIIEAIELIHKGNYKLIPNPDEEKSYYSFPTHDDVKEFYMAGKKFY